MVLVLGGAPKSGNRAEELFRGQLLECHALGSCREGMARFSKPCMLDSGALIFVDPQMYDSTTDVLLASALPLRRWMVIIESKCESTIRCELAQLPLKRRPRIRKSRWVLSATDGTVVFETGAQQQPRGEPASAAS